MGLYSRFLFPRLIDWGLSAPECGAERHLALANVSGRVLELGFGTGLNLGHYPPTVSELVAVDTELMLPGRVARRIERYPAPVKRMQLDAGGGLPFEDGSFDSVVSTWTLCSIENLSGALSEVRRVLKPDGRFFFLEHGRSDDPRVARRQDFWNPIQRIIGRGCNMNRRIDSLIVEAGFEIESLTRFRLSVAPRILGEMYRGIARPVPSC